jgi:predicted kinase
MKALQSGLHVVIDRCNFDVSQRRHWLQLALVHAVRPPKILCIVMEDFANVELCSRRAFLRGSSDGAHKESTDWYAVCKRMAAEFRYPDLSEGFDSIVQLTSAEDCRQVIDALVSA